MCACFFFAYLLCMYELINSSMSLPLGTLACYFISAVDDVQQNVGLVCTRNIHEASHAELLKIRGLVFTRDLKKHAGRQSSAGTNRKFWTKCWLGSAAIEEGLAMCLLFTTGCVWTCRTRLAGLSQQYCPCILRRVLRRRSTKGTIVVGRGF